jgi:hypothetical protein
MYFFDICRNETSDVAGTVAMIVWCIWSNQKNCVWNSLKDTPKSVVMRAAHMINEWWAVNIRQQLRQTEDCTTNIQWQQPVPDGGNVMLMRNSMMNLVVWDARFLT